MSKSLIVIGFLQWMCGYAVFGYIWSIYWGYLIVRKAMSKSNAAGIEISEN